MEPTVVSLNHECISSVSPKLCLCPLFSLDSPPIQLRNGQRDFVAHILIEYTQTDDRERCECKVDKKDICIVEEIGDIEVVVDLVPEQSESPHDILPSVSPSINVSTQVVHTYLVEEICYRFCQSTIGPSSMD